jgi:rhodanese-related sulfurtransferase
MNQREPGIAELAAAEVFRLLEQRQIMLIDVREPDEYAGARIPGALLYPLSTFDATALPPDEALPVVFHCGSGKRSALAAQARLNAGAASARHLVGGIAAWQAAGLPIIRLDPARPGAAF